MRLPLLCCVSAILAAADPAWTGYGGPGGTRVFSDAQPPNQPRGAVWTTPLPSWGHGSPTYHCGRIFVQVEATPESPFPALVCIDATDGALRWQRPIDHLAAAKAEGARTELIAWQADRASFVAQNRGKKWALPKELSDRKKKLHEQMGFQSDIFLGNPWAESLLAFGDAYFTPLCADDAVYAITTWGGYGCWDLDGKPRWMSCVPAAVGGGKTGCTQWGRDAIIHGDLLIHEALNRLRAFDRVSGKLLWSHELATRDTLVSPKVITVGGTDFLLSASEQAFTLPTGKPVPITGWNTPGMQMAVHPRERDVVLFCGAGEHCGWPDKGKGTNPPPAAYRFAGTASGLKATLLWSGVTLVGKDPTGGTAPWMLVHQDRLYHRGGAILDALTGTPLAGDLGKNRAVPATSHLLLWSNGHVYGLTASAKGGVLTVFSDQGKPMHTLTLPEPEPTAEQRRVLAFVTGDAKADAGPKWPHFAYGCTFTFGARRIFVRSNLHLLALE